MITISYLGFVGTILISNGMSVFLSSMMDMDNDIIPIIALTNLILGIIMVLFL